MNQWPLVGTIKKKFPNTAELSRELEYLCFIVTPPLPICIAGESHVTHFVFAFLACVMGTNHIVCACLTRT